MAMDGKGKGKRRRMRSVLPVEVEVHSWCVLCTCWARSYLTQRHLSLGCLYREPLFRRYPGCSCKDPAPARPTSVANRTISTPSPGGAREKKGTRTATGRSAPSELRWRPRQSSSLDV